MKRSFPTNLLKFDFLDSVPKEQKKMHLELNRREIEGGGEELGKQSAYLVTVTI